MQGDKCSDEDSTSALFVFFPSLSSCYSCDIRDLFLEFKMFCQQSLLNLVFCKMHVASV